MIGKHSNSTPRKTRTKLRKPKYLSLRRQLIASTPPPMPITTGDRDQKQLIDLFPLHPKNLVEQEKIDEEHNMACMLSSCDNDAATTLTGILCSGDDDDDHEDEENTNNPSPSSVNYADEDLELVRTAMRRNKTDGNESNDNENWVCYSESSTTTSCYHHRHHHHHHHHHNLDHHHDNNLDHHHHHRSKLVLKLDYEKIMNSWVNKGPLFIHGDPDVDAPQPQTVPDLQDDDIYSSINVATHDEQDNDGNGGSWMVPEIRHIENKGTRKGDDALQTWKSSAMAHNREASVQRYKEKRRNRLFVKTVRYEVRKINAEKRPRIKGRFVKSS